MFNWETGRNLLGDGSIVLLRNGLNLWGIHPHPPGFAPLMSQKRIQEDTRSVPICNYRFERLYVTDIY